MGFSVNDSGFLSATRRFENISDVCFCEEH